MRVFYDLSRNKPKKVDLTFFNFVSENDSIAFLLSRSAQERKKQLQYIINDRFSVTVKHFLT